MPMDNSNFPFVWMSYTDAPGHDHDEDFASFEENLKRGEPFVVLTDSAPAKTMSIRRRNESGRRCG